MVALSIHLPEKVATASQQAAGELGISRTEFIRQAVMHELQNYYTNKERKLMAKGLVALRKNSRYLKEVADLDQLGSYIPKEKEEWWKGKKS